VVEEKTSHIAAHNNSAEKNTSEQVGIADLLAHDPRLRKLLVENPLLRARLKRIFEVATVEDNLEFGDDRSQSSGRYHTKPASSANRRIDHAMRLLDLQANAASVEPGAFEKFTELVAEMTVTDPPIS
jgi:hypothetical protein